MAKIEVPFVGSAYNMPSKQIDSQSCINWYVSYDQFGKYKLFLLPRPGLRLYADDNGFESYCRGALSLNNILYVVIDNKFYIYYENRTRYFIGNLNTTSGIVSIITNYLQVLISDGQYGYVYQITSSDSRNEGDFWVIKNATTTISEPIFSGSGANDLLPSGAYTGDSSINYFVQIDGSLTPNTFKWSNDGGSTWVKNNVEITGSQQLLEKGIYVAFSYTTGHVVGDDWLFSVTVDSVFYPPIVAAYQDGYGIYAKQNSNRFYISGFKEFGTVDALDYASTNLSNIIGIASMQQELYIIMQDAIQIWNNTGDSTFPFSPRSGYIINYGCEAPQTIKVGSFNNLFMFGRNKDGNRVVIKIESYVAQIISTEALNIEFKTYNIVSDAYAFIVETGGHVFYYLTFPTIGKTWVYDLTTNSWSEWKSYKPNNLFYREEKELTYFRGTFNVVFGERNIIGDSQSGRLFEFDPRYNLDFRENIYRERISQHLYSDDNYITLNYLKVDMQAGLGMQNNLPNQETTSPTIMLRVSNDGGMTWKNELWRNSGKAGDYRHRPIWEALGTEREFTFKIVCLDPIYNVLLGAVADVEYLL